MQPGGEQIDPQSSDLLSQAQQARRSGDTVRALSLLDELVQREPGHARAWNLIGVIRLEQGDAAGAAASFRRVVELDAKHPPVWLNLARSLTAAGQVQPAIDSLDRALLIDPYFLPAIIDKGKALAMLGHGGQAVQLYRAMLAGISDEAAFPPAIRTQLADARALVAAEDARLDERYSAVLDEVAHMVPDEDLKRARAFAEQRSGRRKVYVQQPVDSHFPYLPALEYFPRALFPWLETLEAHAAVIRQELLSLWAEEDQAFRPYVGYAPGTPVNQWAELNHSPRWSAWFLWENGVRDDRNCRRCPATAAALEALPLLDIPGKGPNAMFSVLKPRTRIPAHTGSTNVRATIHLPLIVPENCGFRVGSETREWHEGVAWAFDDTIEHEAWNESDSPRALLIIDAWNPLLSEAERAVVRRIG